MHFLLFMVIASGICGWAVNPLVFSLLLDLCRILFSLFLFIKWLWWFCACCHGNSTRVTHSKQPAAKYGCLLYHDLLYHRVEWLECIDTGCFTMPFHSFFFFWFCVYFPNQKECLFALLPDCPTLSLSLTKCSECGAHLFPSTTTST